MAAGGAEGRGIGEIVFRVEAVPKGAPSASCRRRGLAGRSCTMRADGVVLEPVVTAMAADQRVGRRTLRSRPPRAAS